MPYTNLKVTNNTLIRTFSEDIEQDDLIWHWDEEDRKITPLYNTDWKIQFDDKLPQDIESNLLIPKGVYHRLIKGSGKLVLKIELV